MIRIGIKTVSASSGAIHWQYKNLPESETFMSAAALVAAWALETDSEAFSVRRLRNDTVNEA